MSKSNVHPDHYKVAGRDRQDDAAAARQARAVAAKPSSRERPDRMGKKPYFQRPEPQPAPAGRAVAAAVAPKPKKRSRRTVTAKPGARKTSAAKRPPTTAKGPRKAVRRAKRGTTRK
jgi:hypothetical protein